MVRKGQPVVDESTLDIGPPFLSVVLACEAYFKANVEMEVHLRDDVVMKPHLVELGVMTKASLASQTVSR